MNRNIAALGFIQASNALFHIIIFPILFKTFNSDVFAYFVLFEAIQFYVLSVSLYGFDVYGINKIAKIADYNKKDISDTFSIITTARIFLYCVLISIILLFLIITGSEGLTLFLLLSMFPLGMILESSYIYQSTNTNSQLATIVLFTRVTSILLLLFMLTDEVNIISVAAVYGGNYLVSGLCSFMNLSKRYSFNIPAIKEIWKSIQTNWPVFISLFSSQAYRNSNVFILTIVSNANAVAVYALVERYIRMIQATARPFNQHYYPKLARAYNLNDDSIQIIPLIWQYTKPQLIVILFVTFTVIALAILDSIYIGLLFDEISSTLMIIMSFSIPLGLLNYMYGIVGLTLVGQKKRLSINVIIVGICSLTFSFVFSSYYGAFAAGTVYVLAEFLLLTLCVNTLHYNNRKNAELNI